MPITRDGGRVTIRDRAAPHWFLGLFLLVGGLVAIAAPLGLATNAADLEGWERLASFAVGFGVSAAALVWLGQRPGSRVELDLIRSRVSVVRLGLSGRRVRDFAFRDLESVEVEEGADSEGDTMWRPALRLRSGERVLMSRLWTHDRRESDEVVATVAEICRLPRTTG